MSNTVPEESHGAIRRVFDPIETALRRVALDIRPSKGEEWPSDRAFRVETSEAARAGAAKHTHQYGLDLIITRVRGADDAIEPAGDRAQKTPSRFAKCRLAGRDFA